MMCNYDTVGDVKGVLQIYYGINYFNCYRFLGLFLIKELASMICILLSCIYIQHIGSLDGLLS